MPLGLKGINRSVKGMHTDGRVLAGRTGVTIGGVLVLSMAHLRLPTSDGTMNHQTVE
jgi:hypothetical protein